MREGEPWTDQELQVSAETYLFLLRLEHAGYPISETKLAELLQGGPLGRRKQSSIRYRMRNISAILADHGLPRLKAYSPAPRAGTGVRARLEAMLFSARPPELGLDQREFTRKSVAASPVEVFERGEKALRSALAAIERTTERVGKIGHNKPPEAIEDPIVDEVREAISLLEVARVEFSSGKPALGWARRTAEKLAKFGVRAANAAGQLLWNAADAGLKTAARVGAIALLMTLPPVAEAVRALLKLL